MKKLLGLITILAVCVATFITWRVLGSPLLGVDDADIFFVYARNLVQGHGIVYSVGAGHVEGYSSVLYFLLCSASFALFKSPETVLFWVNLAFAILTSLCILRVLNDLVDHLRLSQAVRVLFVAAYLLWMVTNPLYFAWAVVSLMDTGVYSLLVTATFALLAHLILTGRAIRSAHSLSLAALIVLVILSRPEGPFWAVLAFAGFAAICAQRAGLRRLLAERSILPPLIALIATPLVLIVFRLRYFGYPLPNTYYAKVSSSFFYTYSAGHHYFINFRNFYGPFTWIALVLAACVLTLTLIAGYRARKRIAPLTAFAILITLYGFAAFAGPVFEGGDHFIGFRMYQPLMPLLFLTFLTLPLLALQLRAVPGPPLRPLLLYAVLYALLFGVTSPKDSWSRFKSGTPTDEDAAYVRAGLIDGFHLGQAERESGQRLRTFFHGNLPTVGVAAAGGFAFGYQGPVFDMLGLNNVRMAHADSLKTGPIGHRSFDAATFYQIAPDLLNPFSNQPGSTPAVAARYAYYLDPGSFDNKIYKGLFNEPRFQSEYAFGLLTDDTLPGISCLSFVKRSYLSQLAANPHIHFTPATTPASSNS